MSYASYPKTLTKLSLIAAMLGLCLAPANSHAIRAEVLEGGAGGGGVSGDPHLSYSCVLSQSGASYPLCTWENTMQLLPFEGEELYSGMLYKECQREDSSENPYYTFGFSLTLQRLAQRGRAGLYLGHLEVTRGDNPFQENARATSFIEDGLEVRNQQSFKLSARWGDYSIGDSFLVRCEFRIGGF